MVVLNWLRFRDAIYPGFLQALLWLAVIVMFYVNQYSFISVSPELFGLIFWGVLLFSIGVYCTTIGHTPNMKRTSVDPASLPGRLPMLGLFWIPLMGLPALVIKARRLAEVGPLVPRYLDGRFINLRTRLTDPHPGSDYGPLGYVYSICFFAVGTYLLVALLRRKRQDTLMFFLLLAAASTATLLTTPRSVAMTLLIMLAFIGLSTRQFFAGRTLLISLLLTEAVFGFFGSCFERAETPPCRLLIMSALSMTVF